MKPGIARRFQVERLGLRYPFVDGEDPASDEHQVGGVAESLRLAAVRHGTCRINQASASVKRITLQAMLESSFELSS